MLNVGRKLESHAWAPTKHNGSELNELINKITRGKLEGEQRTRVLAFILISFISLQWSKTLLHSLKPNYYLLIRQVGNLLQPHSKKCWVAAGSSRCVCDCILINILSLHCIQMDKRPKGNQGGRRIKTFMPWWYIYVLPTASNSVLRAKKTPASLDEDQFFSVVAFCMSNAQNLQTWRLALKRVSSVMKNKSWRSVWIQSAVISSSVVV